MLDVQVEPLNNTTPCGDAGRDMWSLDQSADSTLFQYLPPEDQFRHDIMPRALTIDVVGSRMMKWRELGKPAAHMNKEDGP
jgi:hypothetical protein